jgi:hypothetical protein
VISCLQQAGQCDTLLTAGWSALYPAQSRLIRVIYPAHNRLVRVIPFLKTTGQSDILTAGWSGGYPDHTGCFSPIPFSQQARLCDTLLTTGWSVQYPDHDRFVIVLLFSEQAGQLTSCSQQARLCYTLLIIGWSADILFTTGLSVLYFGHNRLVSRYPVHNRLVIVILCSQQAGQPDTLSVHIRLACVILCLQQAGQPIPCSQQVSCV